MTQERPDVYTQVTASIVAAIEAGAATWQMPWHRTGEGLNRPVNIDTGSPYRGINILGLWASATECGFGSGTWGTYRQWQARGCQVRKGEKASTVVVYKELQVEDRDPETGEIVEGKRLIARASSVFNADQVDGYTPPAVPIPREPVLRIAAADGFVAATGATIRHGGNRAYYRLDTDHIQMPEDARFLGTPTSSPTESYYATLLHELVHWTGAPQRCERPFGKRFGDDAYAMEELVAEVGAAFLCADLGLTLTPRPDHAAYVAHWLKVLKADKKAVFIAAGQAAKASGFLGARQAAP